tara:strand:+ start:492 stop:695 length:204 start_codon:yes stop_codon:yes gene_type:complete
LADLSPDLSLSLKIMLKILEPIIFAFLRGKALKKLLLDIAKAMVKKSDNTIDDRLVEVLEKALFPGR